MNGHRFRLPVASTALLLVYLSLTMGPASPDPEPPLPPCVPVPQQSAALSGNRDEIIVVLPKSIDPAGCPMLAVHGTAVYKVSVQSAEWIALGPDGKTTQFDLDLGGLVSSVERVGSHLVVRLQNGRSRHVPGNAKILPPSPANFDLYFVAPGKSLPRAALAAIRSGIKGAPIPRPDYIIP